MESATWQGTGNSFYPTAIEKALARFIKKKKKVEEKILINEIRNEKGEVTTDNTEIQRTIRK